ncbi:MAG: hypothetical protein WBM09_03070 [Gallionella sp.]
MDNKTDALSSGFHCPTGIMVKINVGFTHGDILVGVAADELTGKTQFLD